jgi:NAD(P)-dependent dehydrogenase (short-subunit alcohol dehydrogenase family)
MSTAFVTGAAHGIGQLLVRRLLGLGWNVGAVDVDQAGLRELPEHRNLRTRVADVRDGEAIAMAARDVLAWSPVDVVVNNAGIAVFATQEEADPAAIADLFDVNVLGPMRVTRALLPSVRARKGTIVQISSIAGQIVFAESGFYAASKHALEAMSEALYQEVAADGVRVRLIEPGSIATGFQVAAAAISAPAPSGSPYASRRPGWDAQRNALLDAPQDPDLVVTAILASLSDPRGFLRVPVGADAERLIALRASMSRDEWVRRQVEPDGLIAGRHPDRGARDPMSES